MKAPMLTIAVCAALAVVGCGGGSDSSTSGSTESSGSTAAESTKPKTEGSGSGSAESATASNKTKPTVIVPKGAPPKQLEVKEIEKGTGAEAKPGDEVTVQYVGVNYKNGKEFDASWDRGEPFTFQLGAGQVIPGWDQGVAGMKVGGRRELIIPPELAYGEAGSPPAIGPNETLVFVIDLFEVG
jgi:peptidylprolyl isomerase